MTTSLCRRATALRLASPSQSITTRSKSTVKQHLAPA